MKQACAAHPLESGTSRAPDNHTDAHAKGPSTGPHGLSAELKGCVTGGPDAVEIGTLVMSTRRLRG